VSVTPGSSRIESSPAPKTWAIPAAIRSRLGREAGAQRAVVEEGHLLLILHQIPKPDQHHREAVFFWRDPQGVWKASAPGTGFGALNEFLQGYEKKLMELEAAEAKASKAKDYHNLLEQLAPILRASRGLHRAIQQAREGIGDDRDLISARDAAAAVERMAELLLQDAQFGLNYVAARQSEAQAEAAHQMNRSAHRLNLIAAIFLPLTALASLFGMEIHSGLSDSPMNFFVILFFGLILGAGLGYLITLKK